MGKHTAPWPPPAPQTSRARKPLPYEVLFSEPSGALPAPLPSPEEIESSPNVIKSLFDTVVARVGDSYVVKYGAHINPLEGENMRYVREHTDLLVPKVFAIYQRPVPPRARTTYIIMENIPGDSLQSLWESLDDTRKSSIAGQLKEAFTTLRALPHPGYYGSLGRTKLEDDIFWTAEPDPAINGPFNTEDELINGLLAKTVQDGGDRAPHRVEYHRRVLPMVLRGSGEPVFTHSDLQPKNVVVTPDGRVAIVDWATSGWYPSYWEYALAVHACGAWRNDWHVYIAKILDEYPNHYVWMRGLRTELWA